MLDLSWALEWGDHARTVARAPRPLGDETERFVDPCEGVGAPPREQTRRADEPARLVVARSTRPRDVHRGRHQNPYNIDGSRWTQPCKPPGMQTRLLVSLVLSGTLALAAGTEACGGTSATSTADDGGALGDAAANEASAACTAYATALCQKGDSCTNGRWSAQRFVDEATCIKRESLGCAASLGASDSSSTPAFFRGCAGSVGAASCNDFFNQVTAPACLVAAGPRAKGQACSLNAQCQSTWCHYNQGGSCGTCDDRPAAGAACVSDGDCGSRGLTCTKTNVCAGLGVAGGACDDARPCGYGTACIGQTKTAPGSCVASATTVGAACDPKRDTGVSCQGTLGLYCAPDATCQPEIVANAGQACGRLAVVDAGAPPDGGGGKSFNVATCAAGGACVPAGNASGTCSAPAADGSACDREIGPPCLAPARCVVTTDGGSAGTCVLPGTATCQ